MVYPCHGIYMVYLLTYIHGIYVVYPCIFLAFFFLDFIGRSVLLVSFNAHTCVGDQDWFIPRATMAIVPGEKAADKRLISSRSFPVPHVLSRGRWLPALRGAAGRFRGGRLGSLDKRLIRSRSFPVPRVRSRGRGLPALRCAAGRFRSGWAA